VAAVDAEAIPHLSGGRGWVPPVVELQEVVRRAPALGVEEQWRSLFGIMGRYWGEASWSFCSLPASLPKPVIYANG